jgi:hypothetical protein
MALQLPPHRSCAANPEALAVQVIQVTLSMSAPLIKSKSNKVSDFPSIGITWLSRSAVTKAEITATHIFEQ